MLLNYASYYVKISQLLNTEIKPDQYTISCIDYFLSRQEQQHISLQQEHVKFSKKCVHGNTYITLLVSTY